MPYVHDSDSGVTHPAVRTAILSTYLKRLNGRGEKSKREGMAKNGEWKRAVELLEYFPGRLF